LLSAPLAERCTSSRIDRNERKGEKPSDHAPVLVELRDACARAGPSRRVMVFASPIFLFLFLPLTLAAYFAFPRTWRNGVLLVASIALYAWGEATHTPLIGA